MLDRDRYEPDHCLQHFPNYSFEEYINYLAGPYTFRRLFTSSTDFARQAQFRNNCIVGLFLVSSLPVIFHKRIYWFRNYTSKKSRILLGACWLLIPSNLLGLYFQFETNRELMMKYELNKDIFQRFQESGDINVSNPYQQWVDY